MKLVIAGMTALELIGVAGGVRAQLADPTRPPGETGKAAELSGGATAPSVTGLQSVILRKQGKPAALINGEVVELGGMVGEAKLVKVTEDAVVLQGPGGEETLRLMPSAEKKIIKVGAASAGRFRPDGLPAGGTAKTGTPPAAGAAKRKLEQ
jgi:hypothetical protein